MALTQRRHIVPERELFGRALVLGRSEQEARALVARAYPLVDPGCAQLRLWPPPAGTRADSSPDALMASIAEHAHDLVIKAVPPAPNGQGAALDSLDQRLIRQCSCPVWLADPRDRSPIRRVVAAINPIVEDRASQAGSVLALAAAIARTAGAELHILHAWIAYGETLLRPRVSEAELCDYVEGERRKAAARVEQSAAAARVRVPSARMHLPKGHFHKVLPGFVARERIDLVVLGTRGRQGWTAKALLRPYAEAILRGAHLPLLVVKKDAPALHLPTR